MMVVIVIIVIMIVVIVTYHVEPKLQKQNERHDPNSDIP
jgi:uncharacterized membrane protein